MEKVTVSATRYPNLHAMLELIALDNDVTPFPTEFSIERAAKDIDEAEECAAGLDEDQQMEVAIGDQDEAKKLLDRRVYGFHLNEILHSYFESFS